jgi:hypothetical protein
MSSDHFSFPSRLIFAVGMWHDISNRFKNFKLDESGGWSSKG